MNHDESVGLPEDTGVIQVPGEADCLVYAVRPNGDYEIRRLGAQETLSRHDHTPAMLEAIAADRDKRGLQ